MPIEELLAMYRYEASVSTGAGSSMDSSSVELADDLPDMTLDKVTDVILLLCQGKLSTKVDKVKSLMVLCCRRR